MNYWRMAFREGSKGTERWPDCKDRGIAAIGYYTEDGKPIVGDCSKITEDEYNAIWRRKAMRNTTGRSSLRNLAYHMKKDDIIYVKQGPYIVGCGVVIREYKYDSKILAGIGEGWEHFVRVKWEDNFPKTRILLGGELVAVLKLTGERLKRLKSVVPKMNQHLLTKRIRETKKISGTTKIGAGYGTPETNRRIEKAAILFVTKYYISKGWKVKSVETEKLGYDLLCSQGSVKEHVEVKGVQGEFVSFIITAGEVARAKTDKRFVLCVVTLADSKHPRLYSYDTIKFDKYFDLVPLSFRASPAPNHSMHTDAGCRPHR